MGELTPVTDGPELLVTETDIIDSQFGGLLRTRQKIFPTERKNQIIAQMIKRAKAELLYMTSQTEDTLIGSENVKLMSEETLIRMVGRKILERAQIARVEYTETEYIRMITENDKVIEKNIRNLKTQRSPVTITHAEPSVLDPDSDYPDDDIPSDV